MEGPYRDLGRGFARLTGVEGVRRAPSRIRSVEAALLELLRNARDAGARNVFVASSLHRRRYRTLTVIDDGCGIPEAYREQVFEPGVTTRHLSPKQDAICGSPHGAGLSLHHIRAAATQARVVCPGSPTSVQATFDTHLVPERSVQSASRPSRSNLTATLLNFLRVAPSVNHAPPTLYLAPPARILATLLQNHIIQQEDREGDGEVAGNDSAREARENASALIRRRASEVGIEVSRKTVQRVVSGDISAAPPVRVDSELFKGGSPGAAGSRTDKRGGDAKRGSPGPELSLEPGEISEIRAILERAARARYLELEGFEFQQRLGEIYFRARVYEPEDEYDQ